MLRRILGWMLRGSGPWTVVVIASSSACEVGREEEDAPAESMPGTVTLLAEVEGARICDSSPGAVSLQLQATLVGCEPGPPAPCTLPSERPVVEGDRATCPITDPIRLMGVDITEPGRYQIDLVVQLTTGESSTECFEGPDEATEIAVTEDDLDAGATITVAATGAPCP